jgi:hypothetical protein
MASTRRVAIFFVFLVLVAASSPTPVVRASRMTPPDGGRQEQVTGEGELAAPEVTSADAGASSSLQEALVQRPPLPLPLSLPMSPPRKTRAVFTRRSSRMLGSVPSPGVGH